MPGLAVLSVPFVFKANPLQAFGSAPEAVLPLNDGYKMFGVDETLIRRIMGVALGKGGDYCDLYFQNRVFHYIGLEDNIVNQAYTGVDYGVGIRVLKGDQTGYSFTEEITAEAMEQAARTAASIADSGKTLPPQELKLHPTPQYYSIGTAWENVKPDRKVAFCRHQPKGLFRGQTGDQVPHRPDGRNQPHSDRQFGRTDRDGLSAHDRHVGLLHGRAERTEGGGIHDDLRPPRNRALHP
jgi:hypothetical protein